MTSGERLQDASLYQSDFYTWTQRQAAIIREGRVADADLANIAEEIESLGRSQVAELRSRYTVHCLNLLKKIVQPERDGRSWTTTIVGQRLELERLLGDNPGLKPRRPIVFAQAYRDARKLTASETGLELRSFPEEPPFTIEQAEDEEFWPKPVVAGE